MKKHNPAKRVNIVSLKMVREATVLYQQRKITSPSDVACLMEEFLAEADREKFIVICLDTKNQPTAINVVAIGSLSSCNVSVREVFKVAVISNSASIIVSHNHPSGNPEASSEDIAITKRLVEAGEVMGIPVLDHIIIGENKFKSLKELGHI
ncbi:DNA repair protein RadC [Desulfitispora alkaliphila]|uniref:JAB domain-containing protein n=1 Tax=Desulfitispora alkaliphila TaxID=622674 RepID=UPI003D1AE318